MARLVGFFLRLSIIPVGLVLFWNYTGSLLVTWVTGFVLFFCAFFLKPYLKIWYYHKQGIPIENLNPLKVDANKWIPEYPRIVRSYEKAFLAIRGTEATVTLFDPELIRQVTTTKEPYFPKDRKGNFPPLISLWLGYKNLSMMTRDEHRPLRRILNKSFKNEQMLKMLPLMEESVNHSLKLWLKEIEDADDKLHIKMNIKMSEMTLDIMAGALFGSGYNDLYDEHGFNIRHYFKDGMTVLIETLINPWFNLFPSLVFEYDAIESGRKLRENSKRMHNITGKLVNKRINEVKRDPSVLEDSDLLNYIIMSNLEYYGYQVADIDKLVENKSIVGTALSFLFAGYETTTHMLSWFWYAVDTYPEVRAKLYAELDEAFPDYNKDTALDKLVVTPEALQKLDYMQYVFNEVQRYYNVAMGVMRRRSTQDVKVGEYNIKKDTAVEVLSMFMHLSPRHWDEPDKFKPERWEKEKNNTPKFVAFGAGPRNCIGQWFALQEAKVLCAKMMLHIRAKTNPDIPVVPKYRLVVEFEHDLNMILSKTQ